VNAVAYAPARTSPLERAWAVFVARSILGLVYVFAGVHKLTDIGASEFGLRASMQPDLLRVFPAALLMIGGTLTPFIELALGVLVLAGFWTRPALRALSVLVVLVAAAWGVQGLFHPVGATAMNIAVVNFYLLPRVGLLVALFLLPREDDLFSLDRLLRPSSSSAPASR
jgi:uncharacterized membrane protein YphA (DoxX/SURF4 family)